MTRRTVLNVETLEDRIALSWTNTPPLSISTETMRSALPGRVATTGTTSATAAITQNEEDFYTFTAPRAGTYRFRALTPTSNLDTVMALYGARGSRLSYNDNLSTTNKDSQFQVNLVAGDRYFLGVTNREGTPGGAYTWDVTAPALPADDIYRGNTTRDRAANLGTLTQSKQVTGLVLTTPEDLFRFRIEGTGAANSFVSLNYRENEGNLNLGIFDASGRMVRFAQGGNHQERVTLQGLPAGEYFIQVIGVPGATYSRYTLTINPPTEPVTLPDDIYKGNHTRETAANLNTLVVARTITGLILNTSADWFRFRTTGTGGASAYAAIQFTHSSGDLDLRLYNAAGSLLRKSHGETNEERISLENLPAGEYYLEIVGYLGAKNPNYSLTIDPTVRVEPTDDAYKGNDRRDRAANLGAPTTVTYLPDLKLTTAADWFRFQTTKVGTSGSAISITFSPSQGNLNLRLYDASGRLIATAAGTGSEERISLNGLAAGEYYVEVYGANGATNSSYSLVLLPPGMRVRA